MMTGTTDTPAAGRRDTAKRDGRKLSKAQAVAHREERDAQLLALWARQVTYDAIARQFGYYDRGGAFKAVQDALARRRREVGDVGEVLGQELAGLAELERRCWTELTGRPRKGPGGELLRDEAGALILDPPEVFEVRGLVREIVRIKARRARYLGLDAQPPQPPGPEDPPTGTLPPSGPPMPTVLIIRVG